jgi:hypothetical protein
MPVPNQNRLIFVDVLRLLALFQMVNGHTLHALLSSSVRNGSAYQGYLFFRGLVSVAFMLVAGLAFYITTLLRPAAYTGAARRKRCLRALEIIAIGFLLRLPLTALLRADVHGLRAALPGVLQIDVLPCIGVSLLLLEGLLWLLRTPRAVSLACAGLTLLAAFLARWGSSLPTALPLGALTTWLGPQAGSSFPLLPYAGFVLAGVWVGALVLPLGAATPAPRVAARLFGLASVLGMLSVGASRLPLTAAANVHTPGFFLLKLALVVLACAALSLALWRVRALPSLLATLTSETLGIYVFHLFVLYGAPLALARRVGMTLDLPFALCMSTLMLFASAAFALGWKRAKALPLAQRTWPWLRTSALALTSAWALWLAWPAAVRAEQVEVSSRHRSGAAEHSAQVSRDR